jgi:two-component system cell cycle sensor histidine kinase/response regulator CckA
MRAGLTPRAAPGSTRAGIDAQAAFECARGKRAVASAMERRAEVDAADPGGPTNETAAASARESLAVRTAQQAAIAELGMHALSERHTSKLFELAVATLARTLDVEFSEVLEVQPGKPALLLKAGVGWHEGLIGVATVPIEAGSQAGFTLHCRTPVVVEDLAGETRFSSPAALADHRVVSGMSTIIQGAEGAAYGVLGAHSTRRRRFADHDVNFLQAVANILASAVERERIETELRESRHLAERIADAVPSLVYVLELSDGRIVYANKQVAAALGCTPQELERTGSPDLLGLVHPDDRPMLATRRAWFAAAREGDILETEYRIAYADGEWHWLHSREVVFVWTPEGRPKRILGTAQDITDRKRAEEAIRQQAQIIDQIHDSVVSTDLGGYVTSWNKGAERLFGYTAAEALGRHISFVYREEQHDFLRDQVIAPLKHKGDHQVEVQMRRKSGEDFFAHLSLSLCTDPEGSLNGMIGYSLDITERKRAEAALAARERLAAVGQLAAGVAHDFNNILTVVVGVAERLSSDATLARPVREKLELIAQQGHRGSHLIRQILDFSRRSTVTDRRHLELEPFLKDVAKFLNGAIPENIVLTTTVAAAGPYGVRADATLLQQVLLNLVVNSRDAMPAGGCIGIELSRITIPTGGPSPVADMPAGAWVLLSVSDTGSGMPPEVLQHAFEPFFTTKEQGKGAGLGLAQVYGLIKQHDGFIDVRSAVGRGTTFSIYLPASADTQVTAAEAPHAVPRGGGQTILFVEDEAAVRGVVSWQLEGLGYCVLVASSGEEAVSLYRQHGAAIALVLLDLVMPGMGGAAVYRMLRRSNPRLPVIVLSGYPVEAGTAVGLGQDDGVTWLQKPAPLEELARVVRDSLGGKP